MNSSNNIFTYIFCLLWAIFIFIDYWYYHPEYPTSIHYFQYLDTALLLVALGGGVYWIGNKWKDHKIVHFLFSGIGIYVLMIFICAILIWTHYFKVTKEFLGFFEGLNYLGKLTLVLLACYSIFGFCYVFGSLIIKNCFSFSLPKLDEQLLNIATGIALFSILLTFLGFFDLLDRYVLLGFMAIIFGLGWKSTFQYVKSTLFTPLSQGNKLNWIGFSSFFLLLVFISLNFLNNVRPVPFGFDALAIYLNLPNLIGQQGGLIEGYSPYYWSLFTALGHIIFGKTEMAIGIAASGGILSLFVLFAISRNWLNKNFALLLVLFFYSLPIINYQTYRDVKTDLGLLFILLTAFMVLIHWLRIVNDESVKYQKTETEGKQPFIATIINKYLSSSDQLIILLGLLSGVALGIKLTALIFIFAVLSVFSFFYGGRLGLLANFLLTFFIILIAKIDTSLRAYHFGTNQLQWICLLAGISALGYWGYKHRPRFFQLLKIATIYLFFVGLSYAPWPVKNYQELGAISFEMLFEGKPIGIPERN